MASENAAELIQEGAALLATSGLAGPQGLTMVGDMWQVLPALAHTCHHHHHSLSTIHMPKTFLKASNSASKTAPFTGYK
jgi:hypothetical protein